MRRVKYACLQQTIHFTLKDDVSHEEALAIVKREVENYKLSLDRRRTKYKIEEETTQSDGSIVIKIKKAYSPYPCGNYLD